MSDTARLTMIWPQGLKEKVREKVGPRGITNFTIEAVQARLSQSDSLAKSEKELERVELELNKTKNLAQLLADRLAMGGSAADRHEALMEIDFPSWVNTDGWASEMAKRVRPEAAPVPTPAPIAAPAASQEAIADRVPADLLPKQVAPVKSTEPEEEPPPFVPKSSSKEDLFARVMARVKNPDEIDSLRSSIKVASELPVPESKPPVDRCLVCNDELVDGECWTCP